MAIAFVNGTTATGAASVATLTYSPTAGNMLVIIASCPNTQTIQSVVDNATGGSTTYTKKVGQANSATDVEMWTVPLSGVKSGVTTITVTTTGASVAIRAAVAEYSGVLAFGNTNSASTVASVNYTSALTTAKNNSFAVAGFAGNNNSSYTSVAGSNLRESTAAAASKNVALVDSGSVSAGAQTLKVTSNTSVAYVTVALELQSVAASTSTNQLMMTGCGA